MPRRLYVSNMVTAPEARRQGVAMQLLQACMRIGELSSSGMIALLQELCGGLVFEAKRALCPETCAGRRWRSDSAWLHVEEGNTAGLGLYQVCQTTASQSRCWRVQMLQVFSSIARQQQPTKGCLPVWRAIRKQTGLLVAGCRVQGRVDAAAVEVWPPAQPPDDADAAGAALAGTRWRRRR
jgi:hypothetical protein